MVGLGYNVHTYKICCHCHLKTLTHMCSYEDRDPDDAHSCPLMLGGGLSRLHSADDDAVQWLANLCILKVEEDLPVHYEVAV